MEKESTPAPQREMTPTEALNLIAQNIARLTGTRQDHAILMQAEHIVRQALGNAPAVQAVPAATEDEKAEAPAGNA